MLAKLAVHQCVRVSNLILFVRLLGEHRSGLGKIRRLPEKIAAQARLIGMRNTRTIKVGERVTISHGLSDTFEGIVTENNPASSLIYVDGHAYERYKVQTLDHKSIWQFALIAP